MNFRMFTIVGLIVGGIAILLCLASYGLKVYAPAYRNLDLVFVVTDAETGKGRPQTRLSIND
jgi:hypothetical protein